MGSMLMDISQNKIPKIIHQLWIGDKPPPIEMMDSWKDMNPDFEYIRWTEDEIRDRGIKFKCKNRIRDMSEINGQADIMRWEILYEYGGVFIDADSFCINPLDDHLLETKAFAGWEHEKLRNGLVATGTMGFPPKHHLPLAAINWILEHDISFKKTKLAAWQSVGPGLLTRLYKTGEYNDMTIFPSYYFLPVHCTGNVYKGHGMVYAYQEWGSTKKSYKNMHLVKVPKFLLPTAVSISLLIPNYNTKAVYIRACLESILRQEGVFNIELVWIDDGSSELNKTITKKMLDRLITESRNITLSYHENDENKGLGYTLNRGVELCTNELIMRMDADDIMVDDRMGKQYTFIMQDPTIMICGTQMKCFRQSSSNVTSLPHITWKQFKQKPEHWIISHPTVCFRKSAVLNVGNYNPEIKNMYEDFDLWLRMLKRYGVIYNMPQVLLNYRIHENQVTTSNASQSAKYHKLRCDLITSMINDEPNNEPNNEIMT